MDWRQDPKIFYRNTVEGSGNGCNVFIVPEIYTDRNMDIGGAKWQKR